MTDTPEVATPEQELPGPAAPQAQSVEQALQLAEQAEAQGISVDWKAMCMKVLTAANQTVAALTAEVAELKAAAASNAGEGGSSE